MLVEHGLLDGMEPALRRGEMLDRHHMRRLERRNEPYAGIHRLVDQRAVGPEAADQHRAGAAIPLGATLLGSGEGALSAQVGEDRQLRRNFGKGDKRLVEIETESTPGSP